MIASIARRALKIAPVATRVFNRVVYASAFRFSGSDKPSTIPENTEKQILGVQGNK